MIDVFQVATGFHSSRGLLPIPAIKVILAKRQLSLLKH